MGWVDGREWAGWDRGMGRAGAQVVMVFGRNVMGGGCRLQLAWKQLVSGIARIVMGIASGLHADCDGDRADCDGDRVWLACRL